MKNTLLYSLVDNTGKIIRSRYTDNPNELIPKFHRLLPDNPIALDAHNEKTSKIIRIEPVADDALEISYEVVDALQCMLDSDSSKENYITFLLDEDNITKVMEYTL